MVCLSTRRHRIRMYPPVISLRATNDAMTFLRLKNSESQFSAYA